MRKIYKSTINKENGRIFLQNNKEDRIIYPYNACYEERSCNVLSVNCFSVIGYCLAYYYVDKNATCEVQYYYDPDTIKKRKFLR